MKISVAMATYNGERFIKEQLSSILHQLSAGDEIVVSDDGSTDATLEVIRQMNEPRIKVFKNEGRHGVVPNFENALRHVSGDIIFFSDQDDVWHSSKVASCVAALQDADVVVHDLKFMDADGKVSEEGYFALRNSGPGFWHNLYKNSFMGSCMAFRKSVLSYAMPFPENILWHDMWLGLMAERHGRTAFIPDQLLLYRRHGGNASPTGDHSDFSLWKQFSYRFTMLSNVVRRL
ncbi:MAG: glycosyltransferase family 2 protein [Paludibacteraceae bacterium]|nr:glycosyltransferase family 2 protein [Paludibacteraceae bacterium]